MSNEPHVAGEHDVEPTDIDESIPTDPRTGDRACLLDELRGERPITAADESLEVPAEVERRAILVFLARAAKAYPGDDHLSPRYAILELIDDLREGDHHRGVRGPRDD